jgi:hydrogenase nickel incorporation protein HypA/HybF
MHEVAIMQDALQLILQHARRAGAARVCHVSLRIGELSGVEPDALSLAFEILTEGTIAEGAELETLREGVRYRCDCCRREFASKAGCWTCPGCGSVEATLISGRALDLVSLEVAS